MQRHRLTHAVMLAIAAIALPAHAQEATAPAAATPETLDRVVVTAQKREQQVQEIPIAMTAYSGEFIEKLGVTGMGDLAAYVPGLQVQEQSPNNPGFVIRGITSDSGAPNQPARVSVFQDGVSLSRSRGASVELFDMQQVEVLRGPQGTLFGRAAEIGAVHLIQNKANGQNSGRLHAGVGSFNQRMIEGYVNGVLQPDGLFGRVAFFHESRDGAYDNLAGGTLGGKDTSAVRASVGMLFGDAGRMDLIVNYQQDTPPGTNFRSMTIPTRQGSTDPWGKADLNRGEALGLDRKVYGATLLSQFYLGENWTFNAINGWRGFRSTEQFDADGSQLPALEFAEVADGNQWSHEFRLNFDNGGRFAGFFGTSWFQESGTQRVDFTTDERSLLPLLMQDAGIRTQISQLMWQMGALPVGVIFPKPPVLNPDGTPFLGLGAMLPPGMVLNPRHTESFAIDGGSKAWDVFADGTWSVTDKLDLTAGLRWTREDLSAGYTGYAGNAPSLLGGLGTGRPMPGTRFILYLATNGRLSNDGSVDSVVGRFRRALHLQRRAGGLWHLCTRPPPGSGRCHPGGQGNAAGGSGQQHGDRPQGRAQPGPLRLRRDRLPLRLQQLPDPAPQPERRGAALRGDQCRQRDRAGRGTGTQWPADGAPERIRQLRVAGCPLRRPRRQRQPAGLCRQPFPPDPGPFRLGRPGLGSAVRRRECFLPAPVLHLAVEGVLRGRQQRGAVAGRLRPVQPARRRAPRR